MLPLSLDSLTHGQPDHLDKNNMLQVEINLCAQMSQLLLPLGLICDARGSVFEWTTDEPSDSSLVILKVPEIQLELRIHDHYMGTFLDLHRY